MIFNPRLISLFLALAAPGTATLADNHAVNPSRVLSVVTTDWDDDGGIDRALLLDTGNDDGADLHIYLNADDEEKTTLVKGGFAWHGSMWGQQPKLSLNSKKSLVVHSENTGIGRNAWEQRITIAWRDGQFVVAGYTYNSYDRLDPNTTTHCDFNLLSGTGIRNGKRVKIKKTKQALILWRPGAVEKLCFGENSTATAATANKANTDKPESVAATDKPVAETIPEETVTDNQEPADLKDPNVIAAAEYAAEDAVRYNHESSDAGYLHQIIQADQRTTKETTYFLLIQVLYENGPVYRVEVTRNSQGHMSVEKSERVN